MFDRIPLAPMIRRLILSLSLLLPFAAPGQDSGTGPPPVSAPERPRTALPPLQQTLIPECVFAVRLAEALKLGSPNDEAQAESLLGAAGIEPRNGWITDYPVTPAVLGDIDKAVASAAEGGKLGLSKDQALKALAEVKSGLDLDVSPDSGRSSVPNSQATEEKIYKYTDKQGVVHLTNEYDSIPQEYKSQTILIRSTVKKRPPPPSTEGEGMVPAYAAPEDPEVVNDYYYTEGPPVVTYYPPPDPYAYLYIWQPYPFWSYGYYFPGFFILRDFHRHVRYRHHVYPLSNHLTGFKRHAAPPPYGTLGVNRPPGWPNAPPRYYSPRIQKDARAILGFRPNPRIPMSIPNGPRLGAAPRVPGSSIGLAPVPRNPVQGMIHPAPRNFGLSQDYGYRTFNPPARYGRPGYAISPRFYLPRPMMPHLGSHFGGGRAFGGFHGRGGFGGFRGGGRH
jgi:hypothetical protein